MLLLLVLLIAQVGSGSPASLSSAAADPVNLVAILSEAGIPAGLEVREADVKQPRIRERSLASGGQAPSNVSPAELIAAFNKSNSEYVAVLQDGVVLIRPVNGRSEYLNTRPFSGSIAGTGLMRVSEKIFVPLDRNLDLPGGRAGSHIGQPGVDVDYGDGLRIAVDAADTLTVIDVLIQVAKQAPGHSWVIVTAGQPSRITRYGVIHGKAATTWMPIQPVP